ncbi:hypothetical protein FPY71_10075 [Aureimonas fodinaquatilis]|uniref:Uncharacterized protein n=1 Tax=Aureimonas fodinaquatilis TaxID=2565783 RepID=A0A5B0DWI2_9HYPH|nr:hypothetical protein [Aureimonas fodinaquatilis]KAA0970813.1 hypothetical protein FPY71_10075 [Aureimonas fodinaquatilis]
MFNVQVERREHHNILHRVFAHSFRGSHVKVGFPAGEAGNDTIQKAIWNEFGTRGGGWGGPIPERPFLRNAMRANQNRYREAMRHAAYELLHGGTSLHAILARLGGMAQGDIQSEITSLSSPPNSPVTVKLKGSSNPLIDTGAMRQGVTWKVDNA